MNLLMDAEFREFLMYAVGILTGFSICYVMVVVWMR